MPLPRAVRGDDPRSVSIERAGRTAGALMAARAESPGGAACGGAVLLAPELATAALPGKGFRAQPPG